MSKDVDGFIFTYWALSELVEGEDSEVLTFIEDTPIDGELRSTGDSRVIVWARVKGVGDPYQNIVTTPIDMSTLGAGETEFEMYVEALGPVPAGTELIYLYVTASNAGPAGWTG